MAVNFRLAFWFLLVAGLLLSVEASAKTITFKWTIPTTRTNGAALPVSDIKEYNIRYTKNPNPELEWKIFLTVKPGTLTKQTHNITAPGEYCFQIRTKDTKDIASAWSTERPCVTVTEADLIPNPNAPAGFSIDVEVNVNVRVTPMPPDEDCYDVY